MQYPTMVPPGHHRLPPLPYAYNALEPIISSTTLHYHHDIHHKTYVDELNKGKGGQPGLQTLTQINNYFGSFPAFLQQLINATIKVEGSGWGILTWQPTWQRLEILQAEKHQNLTQWSGIPILVLDVWEHAYYLDYQSRRKDYVNALWKLVNWNEVERRLILAMRGQVPMMMLP